MATQKLPAGDWERRLSDAAYKLILEFEVGGGEDYYNKHLIHPTWPGGDSGLTVGIGYDLGYNIGTVIESDWLAGGLSPVIVRRLLRYAGARGNVCEVYAFRTQDISIPWEIAWKVFNNSTVPKFIRLTRLTFPEASEKLDADAFGALVSLVFNRGESMGVIGKPSWERRKHMRAIRAALRTLVAGQALELVIAEQIRQMADIWKGTDIYDGMKRRRKAEADLIVSRSCKN